MESKRRRRRKFYYGIKKTLSAQFIGKWSNKWQKQHEMLTQAWRIRFPSSSTLCLPLIYCSNQQTYFLPSWKPPVLLMGGSKSQADPALWLHQYETLYIKWVTANKARASTIKLSPSPPRVGFLTGRHPSQLSHAVFYSSFFFKLTLWLDRCTVI